MRRAAEVLMVVETGEDSSCQVHQVEGVQAVVGSWALALFRMPYWNFFFFFFLLSVIGCYLRDR
jgi:hypothetical protein